MPEELREMENDAPQRKEPVQPPQPKQPAQTDVVDENIPNCVDCGIPIAKTAADAEKVVDWCNKKHSGRALCRNCQGK